MVSMKLNNYKLSVFLHTKLAWTCAYELIIDCICNNTFIILIVNCGIVPPTLNVKLTLFFIPCIFWGDPYFVMLKTTRILLVQ